MPAEGAAAGEEVTCRFPGCTRSPADRRPGSGRRPSYCDDPEHNASSAFRARQSTGRPTDTPAGALEKRRELVHLAAVEFSTRGYHETTMRDLGRAAGLTQPMLYYYVGGKLEFLIAIYEYLLDTHLAELKGLATVDLPAAERLRRFIEVELQLAERHYAEVMVYFRERYTLGPKARRRIRARQEELEAILRRILSDGIESGDFTFASFEAAELAIWGILNWSSAWLGPDKERKAADHAGHFCDLVLRGLTTR